MAKPSIAIRLGTEGGAEARREIEGIGTANEAAANRAMSAWDRASNDLESAQRRQAAAAAKIAAIMPASATQMRIGDAVGTGYSQPEGSAKISAAAFREAIEAQERYEQGALRLRAAIDPASAAQDRFNAEMTEARALVSAGAITLDEYCAKLRLERAALDSVNGAMARGGTSAGAHRMAMAGASYQVQDFITQVSMGANPINAFAVQGAQLAGQFANIEGKAGAAARFFMGPWGLAITGGIMLIGMFADKIMDAADAEEKAAGKSMSLADAQAEVNRVFALDRSGQLAAASRDLASARMQQAVATIQAAKAEAALAQAAARKRLDDIGDGAEQQTVTR